MLNVERLRALCAVAEHGSIAAAATALHVTPSGVSQQLAKLEREMGVDLLTPAGRGVQLTAAGRLLAKRGTTILGLLSAAETEVAQLSVDIVGDLRTGSFTSATRVVMPRAISQLRQRYPRLEVTLRADDDTDVLMASLDRGNLDLVLVDNWSSSPITLSPNTIHTLVHRDPVDVALPANHPLAARPSIELRELAEIPWITWRRDGVFHTWLVQTLRARGLEPQILYEVAEFAAQMEFVAHGLGAALIPRLARVWVPKTVATTPIHPPVEREIYAVRRADNDRPSVRAGIEALENVFAGLSQD